MRIRAAVLHEPRQPLMVEEVELPRRDDEVLVRVAAAGVCHSDVRLADGELGDGRWPMVLGHEGAGIVEAVGSTVAHVPRGDHVGFCIVPACREHVTSASLRRASRSRSRATPGPDLPRLAELALSGEQAATSVEPLEAANDALEPAAPGPGQRAYGADQDEAVAAIGECRGRHSIDGHLAHRQASGHLNERTAPGRASAFSHPRITHFGVRLPHPSADLSSASAPPPIDCGLRKELRQCSSGFAPASTGTRSRASP